MQQFQGKTAVITGAASGIGRALAEKCAQEGLALLLSDVDRQGLDDLAHSLAQHTANVITQPTDVSLQVRMWKRWPNALMRSWVARTSLFNNAGVMLSKACWEHTEADWQWILSVNLMGVVHGINAFVPRMMAQDREGHIVNTASIAGILPSPFTAGYSVTKHAVVSLSETLHYELAMAESKLNVSVLVSWDRW